MIAYKIVLVRDGQFVSVTHAYLGDLTVVYDAGKVTWPNLPGSKLFALESWSDAIDYFKKLEGLGAILQCEVGPFVRLPRGSQFNPSYSARKGWLNGLPWDSEGNGIISNCEYILADWLKPVKIEITNASKHVSGI